MMVEISLKVNKLKRRIKGLESESEWKQQILEKLRRDKIELENALEQEQEALVNRLWKKMKKLEDEKRILQVNESSFPAYLPSVFICTLMSSDFRSDIRLLVLA